MLWKTRPAILWKHCNACICTRLACAWKQICMELASAVDQYLGEFLEKDLQDGTITEEYAQELLDLFS